MRKIEVCFSPDLLHLCEIEDKTVVVVDILRATSCMVTALAHGIEAIIPVAKVEDCKALQNQGYLAAAERDGKKIEGFDLDNSPFSYMQSELKGRTLAVTTTNGTQAIAKSEKAGKVIAGAFLNISSVASFIKQSSTDVIVLCAGWKGNFNLEDTLFAGALISYVEDAFSYRQDAALAAYHLYQVAKNDMAGYLADCSHVKRLKNLGIEKDISFCLEKDHYHVIPIMDSGKLIALKEPAYT